MCNNFVRPESARKIHQCQMTIWTLTTVHFIQYSMLPLKFESEKERQAFLDKSCGDNFELKDRLKKLLEIFSNDNSLIDVIAELNLGYDSAHSGHQIPDDSQSTLGLSTISEPNPESDVGPYHIKKRLGIGGFGVVYLAEQQTPVRRNVALKLIKPGMDSSAVISRFNSERQALAMMNHETIAKIFEAGTTRQGRPFFCDGIRRWDSNNEIL